LRVFNVLFEVFKALWVCFAFSKLPQRVVNIASGAGVSKQDEWITINDFEELAMNLWS